MKNRKLMLIIVAGVVLALVAAGSVLSRSGGQGEVAVDTTGATAGLGGTTPDNTKPNAQATPGANSPAAVQPTEETPEPATIDVNGKSISVARGPVILLNPSTAKPGSSIGITGSGFDPGATVDLVVKRLPDDNGDTVTFFQVDKSGSFGGVNFTIPDTLPTGPFYVEARERKADGQGYSKTAQVTGTVAGGNAQVKLGTQVGQPGNIVELSAKGFSPDENIDIYWNSLDSQPVGSIRSDGKGSIDRAQIRVPYGAVGNNSFIFVGEKSQSPVTANFLMLSLFPTVELSSYAIKADNVLNFTLKDFGPEEQVQVYLNNPNGDPIITVQTSKDGTFTGGGGFLVPFVLRGQQTLIFIGEQSKAPATASFDILPYTPNAEPSTYGGRPGTTVTFYGSGFARNEVVHVFTGRSKDSAGKEVACFATDDKGNAAAGGQYVIPSNAPVGQLIFTLVAGKSRATTTAAVEVMGSDVPVQLPPQEDFTCTLDDGTGSPVGSQPEEPQTQPTQSAPAKPTQAPTQQATPGKQQATATPAPATKTPTPAPATKTPTQPPATKTPTQPPATKTPTQSPASPTSQASPTQQPSAEAAKPDSSTATPAAAAPPATPNAYNVHTIQAGDTLSQIAQQYGTTVDAIAQANGIEDPNKIQPGQELKIPAPPKGNAPATNRDNVIAASIPIPRPDLKANNVNTKRNVQAGETLSQIAQQYGTSVDAIGQANGIKNPDLIHPGQELTIPAPKNSGPASIINLLRKVMI